jgi:FAD/FMN-containing dehydrogenase
MRPLLLLLLLAGPAPAEIVNDITQLNPVSVERVFRPRDASEVQWLLTHHDGPVAIGGGRYSMGGQTASEGAVQIDMRGMNRVLVLDAEKRLVKVEAGITWRKLQEALAPQGLAVKIMQSYANFTVGGALSVNCHGRYVNEGPVIRSVREIELVLADGSLVAASRTKNKDLFYGAIGGLGGIGVIVSATLEVVPDVPVERTTARMPVSAYRAWFFQTVRGSTTAVFHNGDLYPPAYDTVEAITWSKTSRAPTVDAHLQPKARTQLFNRLTALLVSEAPLGKLLREDALDPARLRSRPVVWRNYEASYDVADLEPWSRKRSTYVLQEYFIPVERFEEFVPKMAAIFNAHGANILNVSLRHALPDPGSTMAWARSECFAFVVYYKQGTSAAAREEVGRWTRELIDAAVASGGAYYLPYQPWATTEQLRRAYPRFDEFVALKKKVDPRHRLRNTLWDKYIPAPDADAAVEKELAARPSWKRAEDQTFLTLAEWSIVYAADDYARFLKDHRPSEFPFAASANQFWLAYAAARRATADQPFNWGYHLMMTTIGASFTAECWLRGAYEGTLGALAERFASGEPPEERFRAGLEGQYAGFMRNTPWYEFPFGEQLRAFWRGPATAGFWTIRGLERRLAVTLELGTKAVYAKAIAKATGAAYAPEDLTIEAWVRPGAGGEAALSKTEGVEVLRRFGAAGDLVRLPRYETLQPVLARLASRGVRFVQIAGNRRILMTVRAPDGWDRARLWGAPVADWPILSEPGRRRVAVAVSVADLSRALRELPAEGAEIDHVYDY